MAICRGGLILVLVSNLYLVTGCATVDLFSGKGKFTYRVDSTVAAVSQATTPGVRGGPPRTVAALVGPTGVKTEFVENNVIIQAAGDDQLNAFLKRYDGSVIHDGTVPIDPDIPHRDLGGTGYYLVQIDPKRSRLDDFAQNMQHAGVKGETIFSSEDAARLVALLARETSLKAQADTLLHETDDSLEHPISAASFLTPNDWPWMGKHDPLSVRVTYAWDYLRYHDTPPTPVGGGSAFFNPVVVAVIDRGFALDPTTGVPLNNNNDYLSYFSLGAPWQADAVDLDNRAGGQNGGSASHGWHGQAAFGVCCASVNNQYGGAGSGGPVVKPLLIRTGETVYSLHLAIWYAAIYEADIITMSIGTDCGPASLCGVLNGVAANGVQSAIYTAISFDATVFAGAGNDDEDISDKEFYPCKMDKVICVGAIDIESKNNSQNYGEGVDIWAPECIYSTITPWAAGLDTDDLASNLRYSDSTSDEVYVMCGTSSATPFVAGIAALMKALQPSLRWYEIQDILQSTANHPNDPKVAKGYVNAYKAVRAVRGNQPPTVRITSPQDGHVTGWQVPPQLQVEYSDLEVNPQDAQDIYRWPAVVVYTDDVGSGLTGEISCGSISPPFYTCSPILTQQGLTLGQHTVTVKATDPFEEYGTHQIQINVVNRAPLVDILQPSAADVLYSHVPIKFAAYVFDADEILPDTAITWTSNTEGSLGTGHIIERTLAAGSHTITIEAVDGKGLTTQDQVIVTVTPGAGLPLPKITSPEANTFTGPNSQIALVGTASDPEDGTLSGASLEWRSSVDGLLGTGETITATLSGSSACAPPTNHVISLTATDSDGHQVTVHITIPVGVIC